MAMQSLVFAIDLLDEMHREAQGEIIRCHNTRVVLVGVKVAHS